MDLIIGNIYLGNIDDGINVTRRGQMETLYVHEDPVSGYYATHHVPIIEWAEPDEMVDGEYLIKKPDRKSLSAENLCQVHAILDEYFESGKNLLIHCLGGIERSPLSLATWLVKRGYEPDLDSAYERLKKARPVVEDRRHWLRN